MKCTIPEISWHNKDPVLSIDVQPITNEGFYRLASGGTDSHVLIWHLKILETGATSIEPVSDLTRHQRAVNVVRWSHSGQYLASGDDDSNIIIWHQKADDLAVMLDGDNDDKEKWSVLKVLRGHKEDVYDICWSPDSNKLISGSVDNTAIIWDLNRGLNDNILTDHKGFVQGVTWDPLGQYVATLSSDRVCRIFTETGKQVKARLKKGLLPVSESHALHGQIVRYFHDDTLKSFFRRLTFSPDGSFIIAPAGCLDIGPNNKKLYTTYIYTTNSLSQPAVILPSPGQYTVAVRCCPILFQLRPEGPDPLIVLPYRIIFAIASRSSVILYDTQQMTPFATISNIHYTRLTDVTWSQDGRILVVSSTDGFCSLVIFELEELGVEYVKEPEVMEEDQNETAEEIMDTSLNMSIDEKKEKKPSFLQKWTKKYQICEEKSSNVDIHGEKDTNIENSSVTTENKKENNTTNVDNKIIEINDETKDKPITKIEVRRKPRKSLDEKPVSKIEVRRKPREIKNVDEIIDKTENKEEIIVLNDECDTINNEKVKVDKQESSSLDVDNHDVIIVESEYEKENILSQNDNTPKKENYVSTPDSIRKRGRKSDSKKPQNTTPARPIAVRRKPRDTPGGQMNITQFLKSCPKSATPKSEDHSNLNPFILLEDYNKTGKTYQNNSNVILIEEDTVDNPMESVAQVLNFDDDSQNIKLYLEETEDVPSTTTSEEKMDVDSETNITLKKNEIEGKSEKDNLLLEISNSLENSTTINKLETEKKSHKDIVLPETSNFINGNCITEIENTDNTQEIKTVANGYITHENCDKNDEIPITVEKMEIKEIEKSTPLSNVLTLPKGYPAKKRVSLITLSSPKHKKKPM